MTYIILSSSLSASGISSIAEFITLASITLTLPLAPKCADTKQTSLSFSSEDVNEGPSKD